MQDQKSSVHILLYFSILLNIAFCIGLFYMYQYKVHLFSPISQNISDQKELPLKKYSYQNLRKTTFNTNEITFGPVENAEEDVPYEVRKFYYQVEGKKISGLAHLPKEKGTYPVLVMIRGYVDIAIYEPGVGSNPAARYFASHGYITLAPDFFGYGESDSPPIEPFADRLISYSVVLQLLSNIKEINNSFEKTDITVHANENTVGIWAHSNGGQIALSVLEISGKDYPTVLWAPVSKPFPYSVLYFTDEFDDHGRYLRKIISEFEADYDIESFSLTNYLDWIETPIQLHQGAQDDAVPMKWSDQLYNVLNEKGKDIQYFTYENADHNMRPDWDTAAERSLQFFDTNVK